MFKHIFHYIFVAIMGGGFLHVAEAVNTSVIVNNDIIGFWGESENEGESFWTIYHFQLDKTVDVRTFLPGIDSAIEFDGAYEFEGSVNCITVHSSSNQKIMPVGTRYCVQITNIEKNYLKFKVDSEFGKLYKISNANNLVDKIPIEKRRLIEEFLVTSGRLNAIRNILNSRVKEFVLEYEKNNKDNSVRAIRTMEKIITSKIHKATTPGSDLVQSISIIYHKYFKLEEIQDLIVFFSTPTGEKYGELTSVSAEEISMVANTWARMIVPAIVDEFLTKY